MFRYVIAAGTASLLMASAASAQQTQTPEPQAQVEPTQATAADAAAAAAPATQAAPADKSAQVQQFVSAELPKYDGDKSGDLNEGEFSKWALDLRAKAEAEDPNAPKADSAAKAKWAQETFANADSDKDQKLAVAELVTFFAS